jgi:hypothetical protein
MLPIWAQYLSIFYFFVGFSKFILSIPTLPVAIATLSWMDTRQKGVVLLRYVFMVPLFTLIGSMVWWIPTLYLERYRFFLAYRNASVIREAIAVHRLMHVEE